MDEIDKVKQKIDIVEFINEFVPLKKTGRNFKANCPFHNEKSASFVVSPDRQIWHCFGCNKGGDAFSFFMEYEKADFGEALKVLAARVGIKLTTSVFRSEQERKRDLIYSINHLAAQYYQYLLLEHKVGKVALEYLTETRKQPKALIKTFGVGYAPNRDDSLVSYLVKKKKYDPQDIIDAGLATRRGTRLVDFFRHRIIFPITDARGNAIAFSGRALDAYTMPKYVNTRETPVYIKGDTVFGLYLARDAIKKQGAVIVVEGEFDVISACREGILNIVAVKGTALTQNQILLLKRFAAKIVFCFDTDPAGTEAQRRSIALIEKEGVLASIVIPPDGKDPDEVLNASPALFKKAIKADVHIYDFVIDSLVKQFDPVSIDGKRIILERALPFLTAIQNEVVKEHYMKKLATVLDSSLDAVLRQANKVTAPKTVIPEIKKVAATPRDEVMEKYLLSLIVQAENIKEVVLIVENTLGEIKLIVPSHEKIYRYLVDLTGKEQIITADILGKTLPSEALPVFDELYLAPIPPLEGKKYHQEVQKIASQVRTAAIYLRMNEISLKLQAEEKTKSAQDLDRLRAEYDFLKKRLSLKMA